MQIILQEKDPSAAARQVQYFGYVSKARSQLIASTKSNLNQVAKLNEETSQALKEVVTLKGKQEAERKNLETQKTARGKVLQELAGKIQSQSKEIEKLKRDERNLSELVERLARAASEKQANQTKTKPQEPASNKATEEAPNRPAQMLGRNETLPSKIGRAHV